MRNEAQAYSCRQSALEVTRPVRPGNARKPTLPCSLRTSPGPTLLQPPRCLPRSGCQLCADSWMSWTSATRACRAGRESHTSAPTDMGRHECSASQLDAAEGLCGRTARRAKAQLVLWVHLIQHRPPDRGAHHHRSTTGLLSSLTMTPAFHHHNSPSSPLHANPSPKSNKTALPVGLLIQ